MTETTARQRPRPFTIVVGITVIVIAAFALLAATSVIAEVTPTGVLWTAIGFGFLLLILGVVAVSVRSSLANRAAALAVEPIETIEPEAATSDQSIG